MSIKNHVLAKQNRSSRQSRRVVTAKLQVTVARKVGSKATGRVKTSIFYRNSRIEFGQINFLAISVHS